MIHYEAERGWRQFGGVGKTREVEEAFSCFGAEQTSRLVQRAHEGSWAAAAAADIAG